MFKLYAKLKAVKRILKAKKNEIFGGLDQRVIQARNELIKAQSSFLSSHGNESIHRRVKECRLLYISISSAEENFLKQKSRINWLNLWDGNTSYFHKTTKLRNSSNLIKVIKDDNGNKVVDMKGIKEVVIGFYMRLLGSSDHHFSEAKASRVSQLVKKKFPPLCVFNMAANVSREEIRKTIFSMNKGKAPGPDGYSASFYHKAWTVIGEDVTDAILEFFSTGKLLKETNATIITLVPKKSNPEVMGDYRPISCCNLV